MISFNDIPSAIRVPFGYIEFDSSGAVKGSAVLVYKVMFFGNKLAAGTQAANTPVRISSDVQAKALFGAGSALASALIAARKASPFTDLYATALSDNGAGVAAAGSVSFTGPATANGIINLYIAGKNYQIPVVIGQTATATATAAAAKISADLDAQVLAAVDGSSLFQVNLTAKHKGEFTNGIRIELNYNDELTPAGMGATITAMSGGAGNPDVTTAIAAIGDEQYRTFAFPYQDATNLTLIEEELDRRWGPLTQNDGHAFIGNTSLSSSAMTFGLTRNSPFVTTLNLALSPTTPWELGGALASVAAYYSSIDPARPQQTLPLKGVLPPKPENRLMLSERNVLLYSGIATAKVDAGGAVRIERLVTMNRKSASGTDDVAYLDYERPATLSFLRYDLRTYFGNKYPRHKLADDGTIFGQGQSIMTPLLAKAELVALAKNWTEAGLIENFDLFKETLIVERNLSDRERLDIFISPDIINGFRVLAAKIGFIV